MTKKDTTQRPLICINNGQQYDGCRAAARDLGLDPSAVHRAAAGIRQHAKGYFFRYLDRIQVPEDVYEDYRRYERYKIRKEGSRK